MKIKILISVFTLFILSPAFADHVDLKTLAYEITFTDFDVPAEVMSRTFNSRRTVSGLFGFGWCSPAETKLLIDSAGNIRLTNCDPANEKLFKRTGTKTFAKLVEIPKRTQYRTNENEVLVRLEKGFRAQLASGARFEFNLSGDISVAQTAKAGRVRYTHSGDECSGFVYKGKTFTFHLKDHQLTTVSDGKSEAAFVYEGDKLLSATTTAGQKYTYVYSPKKNLTRVTYPDGTAVQIGYNEDRDLVARLLDKAGCDWKYEVEESKTERTVTETRVCSVNGPL